MQGLQCRDGPDGFLVADTVVTLRVMAPEDDRERERDEVERPRIRVNDRRLFEREGNLRAEVEPQQAPGSAPATEPIPDAGPRDPAPVTP